MELRVSVLKLKKGILFSKMTQKVVLFDGVCNLCNTSVQWLIRHDKNQVFKYASLQSNFAADHLKNTKHQSIDSIILLDDDRVYSQSTAVLRILKQIGLQYSALWVFIIVPPFIRNFVYNVVARNRYKWFGKRATCMLPTDELKARFFE